MDLSFLKIFNDKLLLTGNEAVAFGCYNGKTSIAVGYPGTPSSEILPFLSKFKGIYVNWSINEKTALEIAIGASIGWKRSLFTTKHVGLNVASDPFMTLSLTGVRGGIVILTADDPNMHSSQNEQDNRYYAKFAKVPLLEPSDSQECYYFSKIAFDISEIFDTPVLVRTTTRISHSRSIIDLNNNTYNSIAFPERQKAMEATDSGNTKYTKNIEKFVMVPVYARKRHKTAIDRLKKLREFSNTSGLNKIEYSNLNYGIITSGVSYQYAKEIMPEASFLKLSFSYPLPDALINEFCSKVKNVVVIEELESFIENEISTLGIMLKGKDFFPQFGELTPDLVREGLIKNGFLEGRFQKNFAPERLSCENSDNSDNSDNNNYTNVNKNKDSAINNAIDIPPRLPALCSGCPHTSVFYALKKLRVPVMGDIGCYTLGALPPLSAMDSCISMGLAFGAAQGLYLSKSSDKKVAAVMGDSTFFHSGITSLIDAKYNDAIFTAIILDNSTTAMTGGQEHPGTGKNLNDAIIANKIDIKKIVEGIGITEIYDVDSYNYNSTYNTLKHALSTNTLNVIITNRPCVLYPKKLAPENQFKIDSAGCIGCDLCISIGCPSIVISDKITDKNKPVPTIDSSCTGCSICRDICVFGFIHN
ncbi:MAG: indolepyruvate ferredoxin oxidoreductase subunit alpha [Candidatus Acididesulfobacter guangdongensis]|uniref:Indolepyruvate oxidoreductase subunit IorA n=1 Tax=Acididesulfobacter guangdongensis TaxID=2597225 RepID=A0A519BEM4_ACIG2|nr:MAG: indolepyruvate ferredoxin oxidoreductase subunit alpha [Candidatus Acididesulfobacter guangdongensis]